MPVKQNAKAPITKLLGEWSKGDQQAGDALFEAIYDDLKRMVGKRLSQEGWGMDLQTKEIIHETYLRMVRQDVAWENRTHFFAIASKTIRRVMVDHIRLTKRKKRGGDWMVTTLGEQERAPATSMDWLALDEALEALSKKQELGVKICEMRYFGGLTLDEIASLLGLGRATVVRQWKMTRAYLKKYLSDGQSQD